LRSKAIVVGALVFTLSAAPASGDHKTVRDPNDTRGQADLRSVRMENQRPRIWLFKTWKSWTFNEFFERGYFTLYLDTIGDERFDYFVFVRAKRRRLGAAIWRDRQGRDDRRVANVKAHKLGPKLMKVRVPFGDINVGKNRLEYRWFGRSLWSGPSCRRFCLDRAPNNGAVSELLVPTP
jgi:hypothetical protein